MKTPLAMGWRVPGRLFASFGVLLLAGVLVACSGNGGVLTRAVSEDPLEDVRNAQLATADREKALDRFWTAATTRTPTTTPAEHNANRETLKDIAWKAGVPENVRLRALEHLASDERDTDHADTRKMMALMLPVEVDPEVAVYIARHAAAQGWTEYTPVLVRTYSRKARFVPDDQRIEREAIAKLNPGKSVEQAAFEVFAKPVDPSLTGTRKDRAEEMRFAAWELLSRLDPNGAKRMAILRTAETPANDRVLTDLRNCAEQLRVIPVTASQLKWLSQLRDFEHKTDGAARKAWWEESSKAVAALNAGQAEGLAMRHVEPVRWATRHRPEWIKADRSTLLADLTAKLKSRRTYTRGAGEAHDAIPQPETLDAHATRLSWGDVLAALVVEEAVKSAKMNTDLFAQVDEDHKDQTTELGGLLESTDFALGAAPGTKAEAGQPTPPLFVATLYTPRPTARFGDDQFVAPEDMLARGGWALAHYHFHVQRIRNAEYSGPGQGDREYAIDQGRNCLVLTSVNETTLNADYYFPGICIDLGEVKR